ncbi:hypothetical protein D3C77_456750 [compost metagenome]
MAAVDVQAFDPGAGSIGHLTGILGQDGILLVEQLPLSQGADDRQIVWTGAAKGCTALQGMWVNMVGVEAFGEVAGNFIEQMQVTDVLFNGGGCVQAMEVEAGAQGVFATS